LAAPLVVTFLPLVGALLIMSVRGDEEAVARNARWIALWTTLIVFALSLILSGSLRSREPDFQFVEQAPGCRHYRITTSMGVDGISLLFVLLTTFLMPICILASWESIQTGCANT
jgi:NADH-quinone oxidoreductase subunit M